EGNRVSPSTEVDSNATIEAEQARPPGRVWGLPRARGPRRAVGAVAVVGVVGGADRRAGDGVGDGGAPLAEMGGRRGRDALGAVRRAGTAPCKCGAVSVVHPTL